MILDLVAATSRGLDRGREYGYGLAVVYQVPGIYGGRAFAVLDGTGEETRHPTAWEAALRFVEVSGAIARAEARERAIAARVERGWRRRRPT